MVSVIGLGFVGLTTALGLAEYGHTVYGVDTSNERLEKILAGKTPFEEPGLGEAINRHLNSKFIPTDKLEMAVADSDVVFICVGTPCDDDGLADLSQLKGAVKCVVDAINDNKHRTIVIKSTVPPCSTRDVISTYVEELGYRVPDQISVANNPEFLREGHCWEDFMNADRIVIGVEDEQSEFVLRELYANAGCPILAVNCNTAEFVKYLSNSSLAALISFANEMSLVADALGDIKVADAFRILHMDKRWQTGSIRSYMYPGCGYGGYCLPKDTRALLAAAKAKNYNAEILENVIHVNDEMPMNTANRIKRAVGYDRSRKIGILGLAFNAGSDDVRSSVSAEVIRLLNNDGYDKIVAYDPLATENFRRTYDRKAEYVDTESELLEAVDVAAILTRWPQFIGLRERADIEIIDCVNML